MMKLLCTALVAFAAAQAAAAPASPQSIETLLALTKVEATLESLYSGMEQMMRQGMRQATQDKAVSPEQQRILDAMPGKFAAVIRTEMSWSKMKPLYVQLYAETFDQAEIDGLVAFYRSPPGQAFVNKMPIVMQKSLAISQGQIQNLIPKMKAAMDQALEEAKIGR